MINVKLQNLEDENDVMDSPLQYLIRLAWCMGFCFPSLMDKITVVLSLIVVKSPTAVISLVEIESHVPGYKALSIANYLPLRLAYISRYMQEHAQQSITSPTLEDDGASLHYTVSRVIDFLPMLYYAGSWRQCYEKDTFTRAAYNLLELLKGFLLAFINNSARFDRRPDVAKFSHLANYSLCMEPLLQDCTEADLWRLELLQEHPLSFVVAGILEILGWCAYKGYNIHVQLSHSRNTAHCLARAMEDLMYCLPTLIQQNPRLEYLSAIVSSLTQVEVPAPPSTSTYLLYAPLFHAHRRCGLVSCQKTAMEAGGALLRCGGGCEGLGQYCCREHQLADWKAGHKQFCKGNRVHSKKKKNSQTK